jgi:TUP1-like enhancer of split
MVLPHVRHQVVSFQGKASIVFLQRVKFQKVGVSVLQMILQTDARAVLRVSGSHAVSINLTGNGLPYITLANSHAYMFHRGLEEWMRVADWGFPASRHHTCSPGATQEDIAMLMSAAQRQRPMPAVLEVARMVLSRKL